MRGRVREYLDIFMSNYLTFNMMKQDFSFRDVFIISLPHGSAALSANASMPKTPRGMIVAVRKKQRAKKTARELAWAMTLKELAGRKLSPNRYVIRWHYKYGKEPDNDNTVARCKAYLDGAASALGINDRVLRLRGVEMVKDLKRWKVVELVFWREEGEDFLFPVISVPVSEANSDENSEKNRRGF